jgi:hypothetical protein
MAAIPECANKRIVLASASEQQRAGGPRCGQTFLNQQGGTRENSSLPALTSFQYAPTAKANKIDQESKTDLFPMRKFLTSFDPI